MSQSTENLLPGGLQPPPPALARAGSRTRLALDDAPSMPAHSRQTSQAARTPDPHLLHPDLERTRLHMAFYDRFPTFTNASNVLSLIEHFGNVDTPDVMLCLQLEYPELLSKREQFFSALEPICHLFSVAFEKPSTTFWSQSAKRCARKCRAKTQYLYSPYSAESYRDRCTEHERVKGLRNVLKNPGGEFWEAINEVNEKLSLLDEVRDDLKHLHSNLEKYELRLAQVIDDSRATYEVPQSEENESPTLTPSLLITSDEKDDDILQKIARVDSSTTGFQPPPSPMFKKRSLFHPGGSNKSSRAHTSNKTPASKSAGSQLVSHFSRLKQEMNIKWQDRWADFKKMTLKELLGNPITVWALVLVLAFAGAVTTAIAIWEAGPEGAIPQIDGNFWSNLSQNLVGAAGLYCIIIPILRNVGVKGSDSFRFRLCLIVSGVGAFVSIGIYPVQLRTSMILAYLSSLAQLLATLQVLEDAATTVGTLGATNRDLVDEGIQLGLENAYLGDQVEILEERVAALQSRN